MPFVTDRVLIRSSGYRVRGADTVAPAHPCTTVLPLPAACSRFRAITTSVEGEGRGAVAVAVQRYDVEGESARRAGRKEKGIRPTTLECFG